MAAGESLVPTEWYQLADRDLIAARALLDNHADVLAVSGMLLQQAIEKYLKGYLLSKGWRLVRTHDLGQLLKSLIGYEADFNEFEETCLRITDYYFENRYPLQMMTPVVRADLTRLFAEAEVLIARIQSRAAQS
ncbi:MAG: HEPN domain-containing protein [Anaerolineales bacterium]